MFPVTTKAGGMCFGFPDVCKTPAPPAPPIPIPYPNQAPCADARGDSVTGKVKIDNAKVLTKKSVIPMSAGDEAGSVGGVISNQIKGQVVYRRYSAKVKFEGQPVVFLTCVTAHNGNNANLPAGVQVAPSQTKVLVAL